MQEHSQNQTKTKWCQSLPVKVCFNKWIQRWQFFFFPNLSSSVCSKASEPRHHIQAPRLITCCSAFKLLRIKAKQSLYQHYSVILFNMTQGCLERKQAWTLLKRRVQIKLHIQHAIEGICLSMCLSVYMWLLWACVCDIDYFVHWCSKSGGSPTVWQIGTPDLCLCHPLICLPCRAIIPPLPTRADRWRVHWGVLDLHCTVGWRGTGSDQIRPDSLCACVCLEAGKS